MNRHVNNNNIEACWVCRWKSHIHYMVIASGQNPNKYGLLCYITNTYPIKTNATIDHNFTTPVTKLTSPQTDKTQHNCSLYKIYKCSQPNSMPNNENTLTESRAVLQEIIFCLDPCERVTRANKCACLDEKYCTQQPSLCTVARSF